MNIVSYILAFICGAAIGGLIIAIILNRYLDEYADAMDSFIETSSKYHRSTQAFIAAQYNVIHKTYARLVEFRDSGEGSLDNIIGHLGEILDDHKEESECSSDQ